MFINNKVNSLDNILDKNTLVLKRSPIYLYKAFLNIIYIIILFSLICYINFLSKWKIPIYLYLMWTSLIIWFSYLSKYFYIFNKNFKTYYLLNDKIKLLEDRLIFVKFFNLSIFLFIIVVILIILNLTVTVWSIMEYNIDQNDIIQFLTLLFSFFSNLFIILFWYLILKRFFNLEMDIVIFNKEGISKITHNSFFSVFPYFLKVRDIWNISISSTWLLNSMFNIWNIKIVWVLWVQSNRHYNYIKNPEKIYNIILKLINSKK